MSRKLVLLDPRQPAAMRMVPNNVTAGCSDDKNPDQQNEHEAADNEQRCFHHSFNLRGEYPSTIRVLILCGNSTPGTSDHQMQSLISSHRAESKNDVLRPSESEIQNLLAQRLNKI